MMFEFKIFTPKNCMMSSILKYWKPTAILTIKMIWNSRHVFVQSWHITDRKKYVYVHTVTMTIFFKKNYLSKPSNIILNRPCNDKRFPCYLLELLICKMNNGIRFS